MLTALKILTAASGSVSIWYQDLSYNSVFLIEKSIENIPPPASII